MMLPLVGVQVHDDFITSVHEALIVADIDDYEPDGFNGRAVLRFGRNYVPPHHVLAPAPSILFADSLAKIADHDAVTVNVYAPGASVTAHTDSHAFDDTIHVLSLLNDTDMIFLDRRGREEKVALPRRSLMTMSGEARNGWQHAIDGADGARISVVYRKWRG